MNASISTSELRALRNAARRVAANTLRTEGRVEVVRFVKIESIQHRRHTAELVRLTINASHPHSRLGREIAHLHVGIVIHAAKFHDIGKVGVSPRIVMKPGPLTALEYTEMQKHAWIGAEIADEAMRQVGEATKFLECVRDMARSHHERWDGKGYPQGCVGTAIPVSARLVAIADVYDALSSSRVYKAAWGHAEVVAAIESGRGTQFDPEVADSFLTAIAMIH